MRAGVGAVASQNITDPRLGPRVLDLMEAGASAQQAVADLSSTADHLAYRQVLAIGAAGHTAIHSGAHILGVWSQASGHDVLAAGNLLASSEVPSAMVAAFETSSGHLCDRLLSALQAGSDAGGEAGPVHSAGLLVCDKVSWPVVDLRCDWTETNPINAVAEAWKVYKPQVEAYVERALTPQNAPSYGVPGDD